MSENCFALHGAILYSRDVETLVSEPDAYVICEEGFSKGVFTELPEEYQDIEIIDAWDKLIIPGLIDVRACAPEYQIRGMRVTGDKESYLRDMAQKERQLYSDELYAERAYDLFVEELLIGATTRTIIEATEHETADELLSNMLEETGMIFGIGEADLCVQCPTEELNFSEKLSPVREWLDKKYPAGLGSGMGDTTSMLKVMKAAILASKVRTQYVAPKEKPLTLEEAFYLATKGGGACFGDCGSFEAGYQFDAVILDDGNQDTMRELSVRDRLERMIYLSDDRNVSGKYVFGEKLY